jgi:DNA polymerase-3 subunit gamma/tau
MAKRKAPTAATPVAQVSAPPAEYTVVARRYRPQQFADLVGQEPVAQSLINALKSSRVAHAYLFTGARGVGKTSMARILAKALNCVKGPTPTPCDECESCKAIAAGSDVDVLEIDGASNRRIEEVRDIRQNVQFRPTRGRYKIYIIDEVHMLTREAFNALLKTLEEPPPHVKFIFATTDVQKVPITILSRCQRFDFTGIAGPLIIDRLRAVVQAEGVKADDEALELVARRAGGSMRDAQSLLDQLLAFGGDRLTLEQVHKLLGTADEDQVAALAAAVVGKEAPKALALLAAGLDSGLQIGELVDQLIEYWRDLMLLSGGGPDVPGVNASSRYRETLKRQAAEVPLDTVLAGLDVLNSTKTRLRGSTHARVLVEMALIRLARLESLVSLSQLASALQGDTSAVPPRPESSRGALGSSAPLEDSGRGVTADWVTEVKKKSPDVSDQPPADEPVALTSDTLTRIWPEILTQVGPILARELEKAGFPAISGPNSLVLRFSSDYNRQCTFCGDPVRVQRVQEALRRLTGQEWTLVIESAYGRNGHRAPQQTELPVATLPAATPAGPDALRQPLVERVVELLGGKLMQMDEGFGSVPETPADEFAATMTDTEEA